MLRALVILLLMLGLRLEAVVAVVNEQVKAGDLTVERVRDMLLGRVTTWPSGHAVVIVLCTAESGEQAVNRICSRSVSLLQRGWKRLVFSGTGAMPLVADTQSAAVELVARTPGAITVLSEPPSPSAAQVIPLTSGTPGEVR
ncbi:MAG: hypothetical protein H0W78_19110 [Planctomycetes bacterium]|jgi:ABC-type phosphate transport system substrate-binding protein|nr:hypothetical protein [Planctomycetota bacterium]